jgi:glyoxylase-like metal-dependent hydrolase (beta-lactamase superfamily II)
MKVLSKTVGAFQENAYLVIDETTNESVFIDPGAEPEALIALVRKSGAELRAIWLTHAHLDHVGGIVGVRRVWPVPVHMHAADRPVLERAPVSAAMYGIPFEAPDVPDVLIEDGQQLTVGTLTFDVIHTPGHAPGHVVFRRGTTVFGGDLLFAGSIGRTDLPYADPAAMERSLEKIAQLDDATVVHPGHGPVTTIGQEKASNPFLTGMARPVKRGIA